MPSPQPTIAPNATVPSSSPCSSPSSVELDSAIGQARLHASAGTHLAIACEHTLEGVMAAVGVAYLAHVRPSDVRIVSSRLCQPRIDEEVIPIPASGDEATVALARRVFDGLQRAVSQGCRRIRNGSCPPSCDAACVRKIVYACANDDPDMPEIVHQFARLSFEVGARVRSLPTHPHVVAVDELARSTLNECERTRQFVRFSRLRDSSLLSSFRPRANTVPLTARHFANRLRDERFCIVDPVHFVAAFHEQGMRHCTLVALDAPSAQRLATRDDLADNEQHIQAMWKCFYEALALPGRDCTCRGYDLRTHWIPKRLWRDLPELQP